MTYWYYDNLQALIDDSTYSQKTLSMSIIDNRVVLSIVLHNSPENFERYNFRCYDLSDIWAD